MLRVGYFQSLKTQLSFFLNKTDDYLYLFIRNLENSRLKPFFRYTIFIYICVCRQRILNRYCVVEKQVLNVRIQDFGCTNNMYYFINRVIFQRRFLVIKGSFLTYLKQNLSNEKYHTEDFTILYLFYLEEYLS